MNPGNLKRRITIQVRTLTKDATGSPVETWVDQLPKAWAEAVKQTGKESTIADADRNQDSRQWRIRHRELTTGNHRVSYKNRIYDITGITEEGIRDGLLLDTVATQSVS